MDRKFDRLRRQQQRLWRKAAVTILSLHHTIAILLAFLSIAIVATFWILIDQKLEQHLLNNAKTYGYGLSHYAMDDLRTAIIAKDSSLQTDSLQRLVSDPVIIEARLYDRLGNLIAMATLKNQAQAENTDIFKNHQNGLKILDDVIFENERIGIIQLELDRTVQELPIRHLMNQLSIITVCIMFIATFIAWFVTKRLTRSLRKLLNFPINAPESSPIENIDVGAELKHMLEESDDTVSSPAPISKAEASGIHNLLASDSVSEPAEVIILRLVLPEFSDWLQSETDSPKVELLRKLDRLLIMTIHSQQGHLLNFNGVTAEACFGLDGKKDAEVYKAVACSLLLEAQLKALSLKVHISLKKEPRLLIRHLKRTPVAIPMNTQETHHEPEFIKLENWLLIDKNISEDHRLTQQFQLIQVSQEKYSIQSISTVADSMLDRQLTWIKHLLGEK